MRPTVSPAPSQSSPSYSQRFPQPKRSPIPQARIPFEKLQAKVGKQHFQIFRSNANVLKRKCLQRKCPSQGHKANFPTLIFSNSRFRANLPKRTLLPNESHRSSDISKAKAPKRKILNESYQAKVPKRKMPSDSSQATNLKRRSNAHVPK